MLRYVSTVSWCRSAPGRARSGPSPAQVLGPPPPFGGPGVNIPDARLAESSPAMTSATLPSGYRCPPLRAYPHVPGKPRQYIVAQPACTYLVLDTLKDRFQDPWVLVLLHLLRFLHFWRRLQEPIHSFCTQTAAPVLLLGKPVTCPQVSLTRPSSHISTHPGFRYGSLRQNLPELGLPPPFTSPPFAEPPASPHRERWRTPSQDR